MNTYAFHSYGATYPVFKCTLGYHPPPLTQGIATGKYHAAVLCNTEEGEKAAVEAGRSSGDMTFPLPYCPELHFSEFNSVVADMKNSVAVSVVSFNTGSVKYFFRLLC